MDNEQPRAVVVGVDGSESSKAALRWAAWYAGLVGARITAVVAWDYPVAYSPEIPLYLGEDFSAASAAALSKAVTEVIGDDTPLEVHQKVAQGHPARVLLDTAEESRAELIVVGSRGHGGFTGALLGSVGQHVVHHARCPVIVIRKPAQEHPREGS